jgi:hypothetical protein
MWVVHPRIGGPAKVALPCEPASRGAEDLVPTDLLVAPEARCSTVYLALLASLTRYQDPHELMHEMFMSEHFAQQ